MNPITTTRKHLTSTSTHLLRYLISTFFSSLPSTHTLSFSTSIFSCVFKALALLNLNRFDESEISYRSAIKEQPKGLLAWQVRSSEIRTHRQKISLWLFLLIHSFHGDRIALAWIGMINRDWKSSTLKGMRERNWYRSWWPRWICSWKREFIMGIAWNQEGNMNGRIRDS